MLAFISGVAASAADAVDVQRMIEESGCDNDSIESESCNHIKQLRNSLIASAVSYSSYACSHSTLPCSYAYPYGTAAFCLL